MISRREIPSPSIFDKGKNIFQQKRKTPFDDWKKKIIISQRTHTLSLSLGLTHIALTLSWVGIYIYRISSNSFRPRSVAALEQCPHSLLLPVIQCPPSISFRTTVPYPGRPVPNLCSLRFLVLIGISLTTITHSIIFPFTELNSSRPRLVAAAGRT